MLQVAMLLKENHKNCVDKAEEQARVRDARLSNEHYGIRKRDVIQKCNAGPAVVQLALRLLMVEKEWNTFLYVH